jgi:phage terminase large subunit-like protein
MSEKIDLTQVSNIKEYVLKHENELNFQQLAEKYHDPGTKYALDVFFSDKYITGRDTQLAVFRHLADLKRQNKDDFPYIYSQNYVQAIEYFTRILPNPEKINEKIVPFPYESFILDSLIGWRDVRTKGSRFHLAHVSVGRHQFKTFIAAVLVNFGYFVIGMNGSAQDFLVASIDTGHAHKLFDYIALQASQVIKLPEFQQICKENEVEVQATQIVGHKNKNLIRQGTAKGSGFDSKHDLIAVFDEAGGLDPRYDEKINQIITGQGDIPNRLLLKISTAYPDPKVSFKHEEDSFRSLIEHDYERAGDDDFFINFAQDSEDEAFEPETWEKSNPLLSNKKLHDKKLTGLIELRDNMERAGKLAGFANKTLNMWSRQFQDSYLSLSDIQKNEIDSFDIVGRDVYIGIDASMSNDNTSLGLIFPYDDGKFHIEQFSFIPFAQAKTIEAKEKQDSLPYRQLEQEGFCSITSSPSGTINFDQVWTWLDDYLSSNSLTLKAIVVDPAYLKWFAARVENYRPEWPYIPIRQTSFQLNEPTKNLQKAFIDGNVSILHDPLLIDGLNNAVLRTDQGGMVKIDRNNRTSEHIDTADAVINAFMEAQNHFNDYNDSGNDKPLDKLTSDQRKNYFKALFGV